MRRLTPLLLVVLAACAGGASSEPVELGPKAITGTMPRVSGETLQGGMLRPDDYLGRVAVVNFWATWCRPCREEQPALQRVWERYEDRGVAFVGVNYRNDEAAARDWVEEFDVTYPSVIDASGAYATDFGFLGLPATFVADPSGELRYRFYGAVKAPDLEHILDELLSASPPPA